MPTKPPKRKPPTGNQAAHASLEHLLSGPEAALQALRQALARGNRAQLSGAIDKLKQQGLDPDKVVIKASSANDSYWYQPAALVLAIARVNARALLQVMADKGLDITSHRCGPLKAGHWRPLAHAFVQGWSAARAAAVKKPDPDPFAQLMLDHLDGDNGSHRLDSRPVLKILDEQGMDWSARDSHGQTILHLAMQECELADIRTIAVLAMDRGVDPATLDNKGKSAIDLGRNRLAGETSPDQRESLQFLLAELSQAAMASNTSHSGKASFARPRI